MAAACTWQHGPVQIIRPSDDHSSLEENLEGMAALESLQQNVAVVSITGNQRSGKSSLMNLLHGRLLSGFQTGHYLDPKTSGLWVWPRPHPWKEDTTILLIDSEGLDSPHVPHHYNWLLSAITLLASDAFMYQSRGSIEQSQVERLDTILRVADQLGRDGCAEKSSLSPTANFFWLLRDHQLQMRGLPREELFQKLDQSALHALNRCFKSSDCVPLPRPVLHEQDLQKLNDLSYSDLSSEFREEYAVFERRLFEQLAHPRKMLGRTLTGTSLVACLRKFLTAIRKQGGLFEDIRRLPSQRELLIQVAGEHVVNVSLSAYKEKMASACEESGLTSLTLLLQKHAEAQEAAEKAFEAEASTVGLSPCECATFKEDCSIRIAKWEPDVACPDWPANNACEVDLAAACNLGIAKVSPGNLLTGSPVLRKQGDVLRGGLFHKFWEQCTQSLATAASKAVPELLGPLQQRLDATCSTTPSPAVEPFGEVDELWMEVYKAQDAMRFDSNREIDANRGPPNRSLALWGAAAGDRVSLALARRDAASREENLRKELSNCRNELQEEAHTRYNALDLSMTHRAQEQIQALTQLEERQTLAIREMAMEFKEKTAAATNKIDRVETDCRETALNARTEIQQLRNGLEIGVAEVRSEAERQLQEVNKQLTERLSVQCEKGQAVDAQLSERLAASEKRLNDEAVELAAQLKLGAQKMKEGFDATNQALKVELQQLGDEQAAIRSDMQQHSQLLDDQNEKLKQGLNERLEMQKVQLNDLRVEVNEKLEEAEKGQRVPIQCLQESLGKQRSALESLQADMHKQCQLEGEARSTCVMQIQEQVKETAEKHHLMIRDLQGSFQEQMAALQRLEEQHCNQEASHKSVSSDLKEDFNAHQRTVADFQGAIQKRVHELELQQGKLIGSQFDALWQQLKLQQENVEAASILSKDAKTSIDRLVAAATSCIALVSCSHLLALARPAVLCTTLLAARAAYSYGRHGHPLQDVMSAFPQHWERMAEHIRQLDLKSAGQNCLAAVNIQVHRLRKRLNGEIDNTTLPTSDKMTPLKDHSEEPLPKKARISGC